MSMTRKFLETMAKGEEEQQKQWIIDGKYEENDSQFLLASTLSKASVTVHSCALLLTASSPGKLSRPGDATIHPPPPPSNLYSGHNQAWTILLVGTSRPTRFGMQLVTRLVTVIVL